MVTGAGGQLGRALLARSSGAVALRRDDLDISDAAAVRAALRLGDVVINCAAYTAVDAAESDPAAAFAGNETGPEVLATVCGDIGARLIHVSTDYVFDGTGTRPYEPEDPTGPVTVYGRSKRSGEQAVLRACPAATVVRTAWVYTGDHGDFVATMRRLAAAGGPVSVVDDQIGSPTYAPDLAAALLELAARRPDVRLLHAVNDGAVSWFEVARAVFAELGADPDRVTACTTADFPRPAPRPHYSVLSQRSWVAAGLTPLRGWRPALAEAVAVLRASARLPAPGSDRIG